MHSGYKLAIGTFPTLTYTLLMHNCVLKWLLAAGSTLRVQKIFYTYTHTSDYNRPNYGKDLPDRACCYINCNCQSKLLVLTSRWICKSPVLTNLYLINLGPVPLLTWPISPLRCSFFNKFLAWLRPQILLCVFIKNWGPQGRILFASLYPLAGLLYNVFLAHWKNSS